MLMFSAVAEIPFHSRVTDRDEKLPFAVAVMGNPGKLSYKHFKVKDCSILTTVSGTDLALMDTLHDILTIANLPTTVKCGRSIF